MKTNTIAPDYKGYRFPPKLSVTLSGCIFASRSVTERLALLTIARSCDQSPPPPALRRTALHPLTCSGLRPCDVYNRCASWEEALEPHGWKLLCTREKKGQTTRRVKTEETNRMCVRKY